MLDYLSILRMHYSQNLSFREIGASVGCGKTAVGRFITRFEESEFTYPLSQNYSNEQIEAALYKKRGGTKTEFAEPDYEKIFQEMARKGQTLQRLWNTGRIAAMVILVSFKSLNEPRSFIVGVE